MLKGWLQVGNSRVEFSFIWAQRLCKRGVSVFVDREGEAWNKTQATHTYDFLVTSTCKAVFDFIKLTLILGPLVVFPLSLSQPYYRVAGCNDADRYL